MSADSPERSADQCPESTELARVQYEAGKEAFERGAYRESVERLQKAVSLAGANTALGGEMQTWLVTAYDAAGQQSEAIALCERLSQHPHLQTRQQGSRLLYILKAPRLKTRPEWLTQIPDLAGLNADEGNSKGAYSYPSSNRSPAPPQYTIEPVDLSQVNTRENRFVWVALILVGLMGAGLLWLSMRP
ncbi:MAG: hypothetical protein IGS50_15760 [Synechococcales cyanobacterium C42_A2020_086]|nr:hypothetical protein [Synechococcales cyanobacterium C42_A2020_086]